MSGDLTTPPEPGAHPDNGDSGRAFSPAGGPARVVRRVVVAICGAGVAGMIVSSIADNTSAALTFGLLTACAVACLMVATAVAGGVGDAAALGQSVEQQVQHLVEAGAPEDTVRQLVRDSVRLGRTGR